MVESSQIKYKKYLHKKNKLVSVFHRRQLVSFYVWKKYVITFEIDCTRGGFPLHYGWVVVWLTFFSVLVAAGIRSISGIIIVPLEEEFGWSRSAISFAFALNLTLYGFLGPFVAAAMERFGIRKLMVIAMTLLVIAITISLNMTEIWHLQVLWGIVVSLGSGIYLTVLSATVANRWFEKRKGIVLGLLSAATAAGQMLFLPLLAYLVQEYSWRMALSIFIGLGIIFIPLIALLMRDRPSDKGLLPYGAEETESKQPAAAKRNPIALAFEGLWVGIRSVPFWLLATSFFICGASSSGLIGTHFIPASSHHGIPEIQAASLFAFMGIFNIIGTILSGWLSDRFDSRWLLFWYYGLEGIVLTFSPVYF